MELKTDNDGKTNIDGSDGPLRVQVLAPGFQTFGKTMRSASRIGDHVKLKRPRDSTRCMKEILRRRMTRSRRRRSRSRRSWNGAFMKRNVLLAMAVAIAGLGVIGLTWRRMMRADVVIEICGGARHRRQAVRNAEVVLHPVKRKGKQDKESWI